MAACLQHLEPADLPECARGAADGILDRVFDAVLRGTGNLDDPVDVILGHRHASLAEWLISLSKHWRADVLPAPPHLKIAVYAGGRSRGTEKRVER